MTDTFRDLVERAAAGEAIEPVAGSNVVPLPFRRCATCRTPAGCGKRQSCIKIAADHGICA